MQGNVQYPRELVTSSKWSNTFSTFLIHMSVTNVMRTKGAERDKSLPDLCQMTIYLFSFMNRKHIEIPLHCVMFLQFILPRICIQLHHFFSSSPATCLAPLFCNILFCSFNLTICIYIDIKSDWPDLTRYIYNSVWAIKTQSFVKTVQMTSVFQLIQEHNCIVAAIHPKILSDPFNRKLPR